MMLMSKHCGGIYFDMQDYTGA